MKATQIEGTFIGNEEGEAGEQKMSRILNLKTFVNKNFKWIIR